MLYMELDVYHMGIREEIGRSGLKLIPKHSV